MATPACASLYSGLTLRPRTHSRACVIALLSFAIAPITIAQESVAHLSYDETLEWLRSTLDDLNGTYPVSARDASRWSIAAADGCTLSIKEIVYEQRKPRLITLWKVPLSHLDADYLREQIRVEERFPNQRTDGTVNLKLRSQWFAGAPQLRAEAMLSPEALSTAELVLPLMGGELDVERALLHAATLCAASSGQ